MSLTEKRKPFWLFYYSFPALFAILAIYLFISLFDKNLFCAGDGWLMQYAATDYARVFWNNVFHGQWTMLDFTIGEGMDPWICMTYYGLTDPMSVVYGLFSYEAVPTIYTIITLMKMFMSGLAFGWYASTKSKDDKAVAMGALVYAFAGFFILWLFCPGIMSSGYLFPMLLYAIDKAFDKKKYVMLAGFTMLTYVTNYYVGFICSVMLMVYAVIRIIFGRLWSKPAILGHVKTVIAHALGIMCSLFVLLPIISAMMGGVRSNSAGYSDSMLWFNFGYYIEMLIGFFTPFNNASDYWMVPYKAVTNFICLAVPASILFLSTKTDKGSNARLLKWCWLVAAVFLCVPFFSKLFNMWMYPTHRWVFALAMIMGMIVVWAVPKFSEMNWAHKLLSAFVLIGSGAAAFLNMYPRAAWATLIAAVLCSLIMLIKPRRLTAYIAGCLSLVMFVFATFVGNAYGAQFCFSDIAYRENSEAYAAVQLTDEELEDFIRVGLTDNYTAENTGLLLGYKTTNAAWNVIPDSVSQMNQAQQFPNAEVDWWIEGWDDRTTLQTLAGVKYFITVENRTDIVPYGFVFDRTVDVAAAPKNPDQTPVTYHVYVNQYNPGVGYMYSNTLSYDAYQKLDIASKELASMKYAIVENSENTMADLTSFEVPITVTKEDGKITINAMIPDGYEVYLYADKVLQTVNRNKVSVLGAEYWQERQSGAAASDTADNTVVENTTGTSKATLQANYANVYVECGKDVSFIKTLRCSRPHAHLSTTNTNRTMCLGHNLVGETTITIEYLEDILDVDGIKLYAFQTNEYVTAAQNLMNNAWDSVDYDYNWISGTMNAKFDGVFQLAVPYSSGWKAYVDGKEVEVFKSGVKYMGIEITTGEHDIRFEYTTPGIIPGTVLSIMCLMMLFVWFMHEHGLFERMYTQSRNKKSLFKKQTKE